MGKSKGPKLMIKNNKVYDQLKHFALITLPAIGTLYFALAQVWGLPYGAEVTGSIMAFDTFLGVYIHTSNVQYNKSDDKFDGSIDVTPETDTVGFKMNPDAIEGKDSVTLKVNKATQKPARKSKTAAKDPNGY